MKRALAILLGVAFICLVTYVSLLNPAPADFHFTDARSIQWPLGGLIAAAFILGGVLVMAAVTVEASRRAILSWRAERRRRRNRRIDEWEERGEELIWHGDPQRGRTLLQKAYQRRPDDARTVLALAASYRDTGELHRARGVLFDATAQQHTNPELLFALAQTHRVAGERGPYLEVLERLRALHPRAPRVLRALRDAYTESHRWEEAAALQEALIAELRDQQSATREREHLLHLRYQAALSGSPPAAQVTALEALADRRAVPMLVSLGDALAACGRNDEASAVWERGLRQTPRTVYIERLVRLASEERHRDRIRALLRKLRPGDVDGGNVRLLLADLYCADGHVDAAARELQELPVRAEPPALAHRLWGEIHRRLNEIDKAVAAFAAVTGPVWGYTCKGCGWNSTQWTGYCPHCGAWDASRSTVEIGLR
jgi:tetratricopeptide (TPR) repeat protein